MEQKLRSMTITLGAKSYVVKTAVSEEEEQQLKLFCRRFFDSLTSIQDQEQRLAIGWLMMAFQLRRAHQRIEDSLEALTSIDLGGKE